MSSRCDEPRGNLGVAEAGMMSPLAYLFYGVFNVQHRHMDGRSDEGGRALQESRHDIRDFTVTSCRPSPCRAHFAGNNRAIGISDGSSIFLPVAIAVSKKP